MCQSDQSGLDWVKSNIPLGTAFLGAYLAGVIYPIIPDSQ